MAEIKVKSGGHVTTHRDEDVKVTPTSVTVQLRGTFGGKREEVTVPITEVEYVKIDRPKNNA